MSKIKEIQERLTKNLSEYSKIRFVIAKQIFVFTVTLYFLSYLFTVGGFYLPFLSLDSLAKLTYHMYSLLVISTAFFGYSLVEFFIGTHFPEKKIFLIITAVFLIIFSAFALTVHLGIL